MSALLKSKNASFTFCSNNSFTPGCPLGCSTTAADVTVTRTFAFAVPPGPVAVITYVVELAGCTGVLPSGATLPTSGWISRSVAFVDVQESVTVSPAFTVVGDALSVTVGCTAVSAGVDAGACEATFLPQPPTNAKKPIRPANSANFRKLLLFI